MRAAIYLRVSTKEQVENYSLSNQQEKLEAYCTAKDWDVVDVYKDGGFSGASTDRPDLNRMLGDIKENKIDVVLVYKLDRLSRSQRDTLLLIEDHFLKNDTNFVSITETLDTSTPMGRAMIGIMSAFAQLEREMFAERARDGQIKRAESGYAAMGGDYDPAGFKRQDGILITKEDEKKHIQVAFKLYSELNSITKVQHELKLKGYPVWRFRRYRDILENPLYNGKVTYARKVYEGRQEKFIDDDLFEQVQVLLKRHRGHNFHKAKEALLSGLLSCSHCGEKYLTYNTAVNSKGKSYRYYICRARRFPSEYPKKCMNKIWNSKKLEELIFKEIQLLSLREYSKNKPSETDKVDYVQLINNVDKKIERIVGLYAEGIDKDILDSKLAEYNLEKETLLDRKHEEENNTGSQIAKDLKGYVVDLKKADFTRRRAIIEKLIDQIHFDGEDLTFHWAV